MAPRALKAVVFVLIVPLVANGFGNSFGIKPAVTKDSALSHKASPTGSGPDKMSKDEEFARLLPKNKRAEFRMFLAWKRSDPSALAARYEFVIDGKHRTVEFERPPTLADFKDVVKSAGWHGQIVYPEVSSGRRLRGTGLPTDEDYVLLTPASRRTEIRKYLAGITSGPPATAHVAAPVTVEHKILELPELVKNVRASVVNIRAGNSTGTGFIVDGSLYTCAHVVAGSKSVEYFNKYGVRGTVNRISGIDTARDIVTFWTGNFEHGLTLGKTETLPTGSQVAVVGTPVGLDETVTTGIVSAKREVNGLQILQLSASVAPGSSGSPVFDMRGQVVGMVQSRLTEEHAYSFALDVADFNSVWGGVPLPDLASSGPASLNTSTTEWAADDVRKWCLEFREWAAMSFSALQAIDVQKIGHTADQNGQSLPSLSPLREEVMATLNLAAGYEHLADALTGNPDSVLYWFQTLDHISSIADALNLYAVEFSNPGFTGGPSSADRDQMFRLCASSVKLRMEMYPRLLKSLGWKPEKPDGNQPD